LLISKVCSYPNRSQSAKTSCTTNSGTSYSSPVSSFPAQSWHYKIEPANNTEGDFGKKEK